MNKNYDLKILVLCNTKKKIIEKDFKKCVEKARDCINVKDECNIGIDFITSKEINKNSLYQKIIDKIDKNNRKSKFKIKIDFNDLLFLHEYYSILCLHSDGINIIEARIEKDRNSFKKLRLIVYITCKRSIEEHLDYVKNAKKNY